MAVTLSPPSLSFALSSDSFSVEALFCEAFFFCEEGGSFGRCAAFRVAVIFSYRVLSVNGFDYFMESLMIL